MNKPSDNNRTGRMLSDARLDELMKDFFRLETPRSFQLPSRQNPGVPEPAGLAPVRPETVQPGVRRLVITASLLALAAMAFAAVRVAQPWSTEPGGVAGTPIGGPAPVESADDTMLVSPGGDLKGSRIVGEDGVTLDETEGVRLNPGRE